FKGNGVLVAGDVGLIERLLRDLAGEIGKLGAEVDQHEVVVGAARVDLVAPRGYGGGERLGVLDDLAAVILEVRLEALAEAHGLGSDDMHERPALAAGEYGGVDGLGVGRLA